MNSKPLVSIIIVNWNGGNVFANCLKSLAKIDYPNWELIIIDNGSTDNSEKLAELIKLPSKKYQFIKNHQNVGFAPANNQAVKVARGRYVLLLNNDTKVEPDFLTLLVNRMEEDISIGVIQPKIFLMEKPGYLDNAGSFFTKIGFLHHWGFMQKDGPEFDKESEIFSAKGACMLVRKSVVDEIGLFDADFFSYFEESDFCWRVWLSGYKVLFFPKARIYHKLGFTIRRLDVLNLNYHYYKNRICSLIKNIETGNLLPIATAHLVISFGITLLFLVRLHPKEALIIAQAIGWNIVNLPPTLKKRSVIQKHRRITDDRLFAMVAYPINWQKYFQDFKRIETDLR